MFVVWDWTIESYENFVLRPKLLMFDMIHSLTLDHNTIKLTIKFFQQQCVLYVKNIIVNGQGARLICCIGHHTYDKM